MAFKGIVLAALLVAVAAAKPRIGLPEVLGPQVVGGSEAKEGSYPFIVSLQWKWIFGASHFCGGSIVNEQWVVTAAHCVLAVPSYGEFMVLAGKHNLKKNEPNQQSIKVLKSFVHEKYSGGVAPYDIALLKLSQPLKLNAAVQAIALPKANSEASGLVVLSGWGSTSRTNNQIMPDKLQYAELVTVDLKTCKAAIEAVAGPNPLHETNICTGPITGGYSACSGDSGGPLIVPGKNPELHGIVSWGIIPCGSPGAPSVYTKVSSFVDWVSNTISKN